MPNFGSPHRAPTAKASKYGTLVLVIAASIGLHGLLLGWPLPSETPEEPQVLSPPSEESAAVDVTILPAGAIAANGQDDETAIADEDVEDTLEDSPESVGRSSAPAPVERSPEIPETPPEDTVPPTETTPAEPTPSTADTDPVPNEQFPDEPGSAGLTGGAPDPVPTLAERLGDVGAYQYNGQKGLDLLQSVALQDGWEMPGQGAPSKADPLELPYQLAQCLNTPPVVGLLLVVVDVDNTFSRGPEVVGSTGYAVLDEQAISMVETGVYSFPDRAEPWAYNVQIEVLYPDHCP
ncbi:MAG: hypothetical protein AAF283_01860 [Cyanobacteria bacterium P01_A01_bin.70]